MKKILSLMLLSTILAFSACSSGEVSDEDNSDQEQDQNEEENSDDQNDQNSENEDSDQVGFDLGSPDATVVPLIDGTVSDITTTSYSREESSLTFRYPSIWEISGDEFLEGSGFNQHEIQFTHNNQTVNLYYPPRESETLMFGNIEVEEFFYEDDNFNFTVTLGQPDPDFYAEVSPDLEIDPNTYNVVVDILPKSGEWTETVSIQMTGEVDGNNRDVLTDYRSDLEQFILHLISSIEI